MVARAGDAVLWPDRAAEDADFGLVGGLVNGNPVVSVTTAARGSPAAGAGQNPATAGAP